MTKAQKKLVRHLIFEITYISVILIALTAFWFGPRRKMVAQQQDLGYQTKGLSKVQVTQQVQNKQIIVDNQDGKGDLMLVFQEPQKSDSPVYYQVLTDGYLSEARCLTEDGAIYLLSLEENKSTTLEVRLWTEEEQSVMGTLQMLPVVYSEQV